MLGNAATNIAFPISTLCISASLVMGIGGAANYNLRSGEGREQEARRLAGCSLTMLLVIGCIIMAIVLIFLKPLLVLLGATEDVMPYATDYTRITAFGIPLYILASGGTNLIRADRNPGFSMACALTGAMINTILDPIFIFVLHWGIRGAALATILGQIVSGIMVIVYFAKLSRMRLKLSEYRPAPKLVTSIALLGAAGAIYNLAIAVAQVVMNNMIRLYGAKSAYGTDIPLAAVGVVIKITTIVMSICIGIHQGCQPIWGYNYGAKNYDRVKEAYKKAVQTGCFLCAVFTVCFLLFPRQIISVFGTESEQYFTFAIRFLRIYPVLTILNGLQLLTSGFFTALGKPWRGTVVSLSKQAFSLLPLTVILPLFLGLDGVMWAGPLSDIAAGIVSVVLARQMWRRLS